MGFEEARLKADSFCYWVNATHRKRFEGRTPPSHEIVVSWLEILGFTVESESHERVRASYADVVMVRVRFEQGKATGADLVLS